MFVEIFRREVNLRTALDRGGRTAVPVIAPVIDLTLLLMVVAQAIVG
jgi:hypothetical protein